VIAGVGIDVVDIARFERVLERTPGLLVRLFTPAERGLPPRSLAARFAAKEALAKALGAPAGLAWQDVTVVREASGAPRLEIAGTVAARAGELAVTSLHVSLTHDGGVASAVVIAERRPEGERPEGAAEPSG
jgi:holo-[acyl-carrier protein] synthase